MQDILELPKMQVVKLNVTDTEIASMKEEYMALTIDGLEDKAGLKKVYEARQVVKKTRTSLVKYADELKEKAIIWQKKVNTEKNRVVEELESIEAYLQAQEDDIAAQKERIRRDAEEKENARIQGRIDKLAAYGFGVDYNTVKTIDDDSFEIVLNNAKNEHAKELAAKAEQERLAAEETARLKAEREELEKLRREQAEAQRIIKAEQDRVAKEQADKQASIEAEAARLRQEKADQEAKIRKEEERIELEKNRAEQKRLHDEAVLKAREEAAESARLKAIADAKKAEETRIENERLEKAEAERQASLRPDKEKLQSFSDNLASLKLPTVANPAAQEIVNEIQLMINKMQAHIIRKIKVL